jgi:tetratricopeptide (TPR) repeat protein
LPTGRLVNNAFRRTQNYSEALKVLTKAITKYPKFAEAFAARGQIYLFLKQWDKAFVDFKNVLLLSKNNGLGLLGQGDAYRGIGKLEKALHSYSEAIEVDKESQKQALMKRGILYLQMAQNNTNVQNSQAELK